MISLPQCGVYAEYTHGKSWTNWEIDIHTHIYTNRCDQTHNPAVHTRTG